MITWRSAPGGATADVRLRGLCLARLHARKNAWRVQLLDGEIAGPAGSLGHAKRAALDAIAEALPELEIAVRTALARG